MPQKPLRAFLRGVTKRKHIPRLFLHHRHHRPPGAQQWPFVRRWLDPLGDIQKRNDVMRLKLQAAYA